MIHSVKERIEAVKSEFLRAVDWMKDLNGIEVNEKHYRRLGLIAEDLYKHIIWHNRASYTAESEGLNFWETLENESGDEFDFRPYQGQPGYWEGVVRNFRMMIFEFIPDLRNNMDVPITAVFPEAKLTMLSAISIDPDTDYRRMINEYFVPFWCGSTKDLYCEILPFLGYKNINASKLSLIDIAFTRLAFEVGLHIGDLLHSGAQLDFNRNRLILGKQVKQSKKEKRKQKTIEIYYTIDPKKRKQGKYTLANAIINKWVPKDQAPSRDSIIRYLRDQKLIE